MSLWLLHVQGEAESALGELQSVRREQGKAQAEASAAMQDAREALARESDIQGQLQKADQVRGAVSIALLLLPQLPVCSREVH